MIQIKRENGQGEDEAYAGPMWSPDDMPIPVLIVSRNGWIVDANRPFRRVYGYQDDLDGAAMDEVLPGYDPEQMLDDLQRTGAKPHFQAERFLLTGFGEQRCVLVKLRNLDKSQGDPSLMLALTDVTHLRRHVQETTAQITKLYHLADSSSDVILSVNERGYVDYVNDAGCKLLGYPLTELIGTPLGSVVVRRRGSNGAEASETHPQRTIAIGRGGHRIPVEMKIREVPLPGKWIHIVSLRPLVRPSAGTNGANGLEDSGEWVKKRIGQDLHDTLGQMLTGMRMMGSQLLKQLENESGSAAQEMKEMLGLLKEADEFTHILAHGMLRPMDEGTLSDHLRSECERVARLFRVECRFESHLAVSITDPVIVSNVVPMVQEALSNAIRHGSARRMQVTIRESDLEWLLSIEDDGMGFRRRGPSGPHSGLGLRIMKERAELLGGGVRFRRTSRSTTRVECDFPKDLLAGLTPHSERERRKTGHLAPAAAN